MMDCNLVSTSMEAIRKLYTFYEGERVDATTYTSLVGSLLYLTCTRMDILYSVRVVRGFMKEPVNTHLEKLHTFHIALGYSYSKQMILI